MPAIIATGVVVGMLVAFGIYSSYVRKDRSISLLVSALVAGCICFGISFPLNEWAHSLSKADKVSGYEQALNGSVIQAVSERFQCHKVKETEGGTTCAHYSHCDKYTVSESYTETRTEYYTDSNGKPASRTVTEIKWHDVDHWHECPDATVEYTYTLIGSVGDTRTIASHIYGSDSKPMYGSLGNVQRTVPEEWERARLAIAAGNAPSITARSTYDNYILGSETADLLKAHSSDIDSLKKHGLLPGYPPSIAKNNTASKMDFAGFTSSITSTWQDVLMHFNSRFGSGPHGDLHIVAVRDSQLQGMDPSSYVRAIKAYWQAGFGKKSLAKNVVILAIGVDDTGTVIKWARAETGMPIGNGAMKEVLASQLADKPFDPITVLGDTKASIVKNAKGELEPSYSTTGGIVPQVMFVEQPFKRACMKCDDAEDKGQQGFVDLQDAIPISGKTAFWLSVLEVFLSLLIYGIGLTAFTRITFKKNWFTRSSSSSY